MRLATVLLLASGCDKLFGITAIGNGSASGAIDAVPGPADAPSAGDGMPDIPWVCAPPPQLTTWVGSNFSVVGSYSMFSHPTTDIVAQKFYFAAAGDIYQCNLGTNLRNADTCSVVLAISGVDTETAPSLAADGKTMYFDRNSMPMQSLQAANGTWLNAAPLLLPGRLATAEVGAPSAMTSHGMRMLVSDGNDLAEVSYDVTTGWVEVQGTLANLNHATTREVDPYLSPDGCWTVFASDSEHPGNNLDVFFAKRNPTGEFAPAVSLDNFNNDVTDDRGPFVANGQILYYVRGTNPEVAEPP